MMRWRVLALFAVAAVLPTFSLGADNTNAAAPFKAHCAMCHGPDARGNTPVGKMMHIPDLLSKPIQSKSDADLTAVIENGKGKMPEFKSKLKSQEIHDLVAYLRSLSKSSGAAK